jgi:hypothetical protein
LVLDVTGMVSATSDLGASVIVDSTNTADSTGVSTFIGFDATHYSYCCIPTCDAVKRSNNRGFEKEMNASLSELEIMGIIYALRKNNPHITVEEILAATRAGLKSRGIKWNAALEFKVRYCADKYPN